MVSDTRTENPCFTLENNIVKGYYVPPQSTYNNVGKLLWDFLQKHAELKAQLEIATNVEDTFAEMTDRIVKCALWLQKQGVGKGDIIAISTHNHINCIIPCIAALFIGAAFNPWDSNMNIQLARHFMSVTKPKIVFANEQSAGTILEAAKIEVLPIKVVVFGHYFGLTSFSEVLCNHKALSVENFQCVEFKDPDHVAMIMFSSGTTGLPKGVQVGHRALIRYLEAPTLLYFSDITTLWYSSLYWISGVLLSFKCIKFGGRHIIPPPYEEKTTCEIIEKYKVKWLLLGTSMSSRFARYSRLYEYDLSSLKYLLIGGSSLKQEAQDFIRERMPDTTVLQLYGMTEMCGVVTSQSPNATSGSCGIIAPFCEMRIIDTETGHNLGPNQHGELCLKSYVMMTCYYKNPEATKRIIDDEGWLHSGDLAYYNDEGELFIVDRLKELIKYRGNAVIPTEIEQRLLTCPGVLEVGVVGIPHITDGEHPVAFVSKTSSSRVTETDLLDVVALNFMDHYKLRGGVKFLPSLPHTASGKISKKELKAMAKAMAVF